MKVKEDGAASRSRALKRAPERLHYHHGALKDALVEASEAILLERGVGGFTLRAVARRVGVSPAAPTHHFGDVAGLLTEVAARGFEALAQALREAEAQAGADPASRLDAQGRAYVAFALRHPARVRLMFRRDMCDPEAGHLKEAASAAFAVLEDGVRAFCGVPPGAAIEGPAFGTLLAAWSLVHGFAQLALDGAFDAAAAPMGGPEAILTRMLPAVLATLTGRVVE
jgi:AcrR family transcriptional regulator